MSRKQTILAVIPIAIVAGLLIRTWWHFLVGEYIPQSQHWLALFLFLPVVFFLVRKKMQRAVIAMGCFLALAAINIVAFTVSLITVSVGITKSDMQAFSPAFNLPGFLLLLLWGIVNVGTLIDMHLDYKETRRTTIR